MKPLLDDDYLLRTDEARTLYRDFAAGVPIVDYHCHLEPRDLARDRRFENIAQLWVTSDPYKHRAMRLAGVPERLITGASSDREKFDAWAATVPQTLGNPLSPWTMLELERYFGVAEPLSTANAGRVWDHCNERLREPAFSARGLLRQRGVRCICTSDRLLDDLAPHAELPRADGQPGVLPSLRADDVVAIEGAEYVAWVQALARATGGTIGDFDAFCAAVERRLDHFAAAGCRLADHALDDFTYERGGAGEELFARRLRGEMLSTAEIVRLRSALLRFLGAAYARRGWIMQLHLGAQRHTSSRLRRLVGPAGGYASIGRAADVPSLCTWFDDLEQADALPRVLLYPLDPADFVPLAVLCGSFVRDGVPGQLQLGPAWWFNDHAAGMRAQLEAVASHSLLATFIGMTTDSRSLLSMVRHEYFRRVLCAWLGDKIAAGELPADVGILGPLVTALSGGNAARALAL